MFCEKCGTSVDDEPFCPNCGNRLRGSSASYASADSGASRSYGGSLLGKLNAMEEQEKRFYACTGGLLLACFLFSLLKIFSISSSLNSILGELASLSASAPMASGNSLFANLFTVLFTLCITFFVMDYFDKFTFKWLWYFIVGSAALILLSFIIMWINSDCALTLGGWLFFLSQIGLTAVSVLYLREKRE